MAVVGIYNVGRLFGLQEPVRKLAIQFLNRAKAAGISVTVIEGKRTPEKQAELYAGGKTTQAKPWWSFHQYGTAFDFAPTVVLKKSDWEPNNPLWEQLGQIAESLGFEWGGRWRRKDRPHLEYHPGLTINEVVSHFKKTGQVLLSKVLTPEISIVLGGAIIIGIYYISKKLKL